MASNKAGEISLDLLLNSDNYDKGLKDAESKASGFGSKVGTAMKVGVAAIGAATVAAGKAVYDLTEASVKSYAEYEQLVGGVETLFKTSSDKVMEYADNAFKTAGLSSNQYMETVTSFSASLLQSLDGDTAKAADVADKAIVDMADNANKMGTSMESIQNAYQGFAKQNYTMLDNLKLGYGGTKSEMERLLADAEKMPEAMGREFNLDNYADVIEAIHVVQEHMGIAGTTAKEASETISGSLASAKSSWQNLVTGLSNDQANLDSLIDNFVDSVSTAADNIIPVVEKALNGIAELITKIAPKIVEMLPGLVEKIIPPAVEAIKSILNSIINALPGLIKTLLPVIIDILVGAFDTLIKIIPDLIQMIVDILPQTLTSIIDGITQLIMSIAEVLPEIIPILIDALVETLPMLIEALINALPTIIEGLITLVVGIVEHLPEIINALIKALPTIIKLVIDGLLKALPQLIAGLVKLTVEVVKHLPEIIAALIEAIPLVIEAILEAFFPVTDGIGDLFGDAVDKAEDFLDGVADWISENVIEPIKNFISPFIEFVQTVFENLINIIKAVLTVAANWVEENVTGPIKEDFERFSKSVSEIFDDIKEFVTKIFNGIKETVQKIINEIKDFVKPIADWVKKNVTEPIGKFFTKLWDGITSGIKSALNTAISVVERFINKIVRGINWFMSGINRASSWASEITGGFIPSIPEISEVSLPRLAMGGFVEANTPQPVIVGDNRHQGEIIAPEGKITEAVNAALTPIADSIRALASAVQNNQQTIGDIHIPVSIGNKKIEDIYIRSEQLYNLRTGGY